MTQPEWELRWSTDYTALYVDSTGVYAPELEHLDEIFDNPDDERFICHRVELERYRLVDNPTHRTRTDADARTRERTSVAWGEPREPTQYLVPLAWEPTWRPPIASYVPWWYENLGGVASCVGRDREDIIADIISDDPDRLASAYQDIYAYHGWDNGDGYPQMLATWQAEEWPDWRDAQPPNPEDTDD